MKSHKISITITTEGSYGSPMYEAIGSIRSDKLVETFHYIRELRLISEEGFEDLITKMAGEEDSE